MNTINATYTIPWCRDWLPVTKIFYINWTGKACYFYSDGLTNIDWTPDDTGWTEGSCDSVPAVVSGWFLWIIAWEAINNIAPWTPFYGAPTTVNTTWLSNIQAITITALGVTDSWTWEASANQIVITYPNLTQQPMFDWQTLSFSVVKWGDINLAQDYYFYASWTAYASINYTYY